MRKYLALLLLLIASPALGSVTLPHTQHWTAISPWTQVYSNATIDSTQSASGSSSTSLRFRFPLGYAPNNAPDKVYTNFTATSEIYVQYWIKYSDNYYFHPADNKQTYYVHQGAVSNFYVSRYYGKMSMVVQRSDASARWSANTGYNPTLAAGTWYKVTIRAKMNTSAVTPDGIFQLWINDQLVINHSTVRFLKAADLGVGVNSMEFTPVYGGGAPASNKPAEDYQYYDYVQIQTTPFGGGGGDVSAPYLSQWSPAKSSTGVLVGNRTISFHIQDDTDVLTANGNVNIEGVDYTCASGLTCTGGSTDKTITFTNGSDWAYDQVVNISTTGFRDTAGNIMATDTWSYTIASDPGPALEVTTTSVDNGTVGTAYSDSVTASGGTSPYTWAVTAGSLPAGLSLSASGAITGIPTTAGISTFTVTATDAASATDDQALSITVAAATPGGQTTTLGTGINDTYINSGSAGTNYSDNAALRVYQWPIGTTANRTLVIDNTDIQSIPDNVSITSATLRLYLTGHDGSGGTDPMRVHAKSISGSLPDPATVTWTSFAGTLGSDLSVTDVTLVPGWFEWNVLSAVQAAYAAREPVYIAMDGGSDGAADTNRIFASMDHGTAAWRPQLTITYMQLVAPGGPSISAPGKLRVTRFKGRFN